MALRDVERRLEAELREEPDRAPVDEARELRPDDAFVLRPALVFHAMRSFLRRSVMRASRSRLLNQIFSFHLMRSLPAFWTFRTRCMNCGNLSKSVHAS